MKREAIRDRIRSNLLASQQNPKDIRVQPAPFGGWVIVVISEGYNEHPLSERKRVTLEGLEDLTIEWLDLLTPEERDFAGALPIDSDLDDIPLWAEVLGRGNLDHPAVIFPSDLDKDIAPPIIATFYSLRGGVGRSSALAYSAKILAHRGQKVVCVDMDLEAPGLAALFGVEGMVTPDNDIVGLLMQLDQGQQTDITSYLLRIDDSVDLYLLPAGKPDADYARRLQFIDPYAWYREDRNPLRLLIEGLENKLSFKPDVVLFDSRTGITPLSAPLLFDLADLAFITFFPHPQTRTGTTALVKGLLASYSKRHETGYKLTPEPRFIISPIPASKAPEVIKRYEHRALEWISQWLESVNQGRDESVQLLENEISHFVRYREVVATSDTILRDSEIWRNYEPIADWVIGFLPTKQEQKSQASLGGFKENVLNNLHFSAGTAENQEQILDTFVQTDAVNAAIDPRIPLILGRKGAGKTAIFRWLSEREYNQAVVQAPSNLRDKREWMLSADGFKAVDDILKKAGADWRQFWTFYSCLAVAHEYKNDAVEVLPEGGIADIRELPVSEIDVIAAFEKIAGITRSGLKLNDWLQRLDRASKPDMLLIFDGLDTGFGNTVDDRKRRKSAIEGLFDFWTNFGDNLNHFCFKILLREDIWRHLRFENKSHLYGRSVTLKWQKQADYCKVVLSQAFLSDQFKELLKSSLARNKMEISIDEWSSQDVFSAWNVLVGERMKGGKTTFTRNWVWNRLADGNEDHTPRYLLQLFHEVVPWERNEHSRTPYERSIIRPRALTQCLSAVSEQAIQSLEEEFSELSDLLECLKKLGRTPLAADDLKNMEDEVSLAREVGLLSVYEKTEDDQVTRFKVPDVYRQGLKMTRKGQA